MTGNILNVSPFHRKHIQRPVGIGILVDNNGFDAVTAQVSPPACGGALFPGVEPQDNYAGVVVSRGSAGRWVGLYSRDFSIFPSIATRSARAGTLWFLSAPPPHGVRGIAGSLARQYCQHGIRKISGLRFSLIDSRGVFI